ncbi:unnamed protein product [Fraxinus pennsylvanica]|uniref:Uncharacterized protein n=1 Tax=Fraxinus pennsylvanica TaxID=56036 RepID=A0AAD2AK23_9LAMI|nr:unnamed protein product [Fraxinus pennsylvanica]
MAIEEEDFSFPATTADAQPRFIDSPPLWRPVSVPPPHQKPERLVDKEESRETYNSNQRKNFSRGMKMKWREEDNDVGDELEEKMDMLWEDLNEEFSRKLVVDSGMSSSHRDVQISCVKTLKLSKPNGNLLSGKKLSIVLLMKILTRKVFFVHNTRSSIKNRAC